MIAENTHDLVLTSQMRNILPGIRHFLAEDVRTARRYLSSLKIFPSIEPLQFEVLDKKTKIGELGKLMQPILQGFNVGVITDAGCPGIADPGALAVSFAHQHEIKVVPVIGPSSILLALMASGLNGQSFAFQGYLPVNTAAASAAIQKFEKESRSRNQTQIFIETPYRNNSLWSNLLKSLSPETLLTIAYDVTGENEWIATRKVEAWRTFNKSFEKLPAVFLFLAS